jgi:hypothetical protein
MLQSQNDLKSTFIAPQTVFTQEPTVKLKRQQLSIQQRFDLSKQPRYFTKHTCLRLPLSLLLLFISITQQQNVCVCVYMTCLLFD